MTLTSNTNVADTFTSSSVGQDRFVFQPAFGQDLVTNFHAGSGSQHDTLQFASSIASSYQQLQSSISQTNAGALITIDPSDTILLKGVTVAALTSSDFSFKHA